MPSAAAFRVRGLPAIFFINFGNAHLLTLTCSVAARMEPRNRIPHHGASNLIGPPRANLARVIASASHPRYLFEGLSLWYGSLPLPPMFCSLACPISGKRDSLPRPLACVRARAHLPGRALESCVRALLGVGAAIPLPRFLERAMR